MLKALLLLFSFSVFASGPTVPKLFFSYSPFYDRTLCTVGEVKEEWVSETRKKLDFFSSSWDSKGQAFFDVLFERVPRGFSRKELSANLSVCPKHISFSNPLILKVTWYLESFMAPKPALGDKEFVDLVFHELLHTWIIENLKGSRFFIRYANENPSVKSHLHLMAIQKFVYLKLGRSDLVTLINDLYTGRGGDYLRAWEIVKLEGHEEFLKDFDQ